jgi:hypothetical protein
MFSHNGPLRIIAIISSLIGGFLMKLRKDTIIDREIFYYAKIPCKINTIVLPFGGEVFQ